MARRKKSSTNIIPLWGSAKPDRGRNYIDIALAFVQDFPLGTVLRSEEIDVWADQHGIYQIPAVTDKKSDAWLALLSHRKLFRNGLNKAASHPRMNDLGSPGAYHLGFDTKERRNQQLYVVQSPLESIAEHEITVRTTSLVAKKRQDLQYLLQSCDWSLLPPYERVFAEILYDDIAHYERSVKNDGEDLDEKFRKFRARLDQAMLDAQRHLPRPPSDKAVND